jgi:GST-like protein
MNAILYHGEPNGPSLTVLAALFEKGVPADLVHVDLTRGERHRLEQARGPEVAMSVEGEGPVLLVEGEAMADSVFIACYLDDVGEGPALRPRDPYGRWALMSWCRQIIERTAPAAAYLGCRAYPPMPPGDALARIESADLKERWQDVLAGRFADDKVADCETKIAQAVERIEARRGGEWLMGGFSIADLESYAWLAGMAALVPKAFAGKPRTDAWMARVKSRPSVARALALARVPDPTRSWAPGPEINRWG